MLRARGLLSAVLAACAVCALPPAAGAQSAPVPIDGTPLNIWVSAGGQLQVRYDRESLGQFYPASGDIGDAGFNLFTNVGAQKDFRVWGFSSSTDIGAPGDTPFRALRQEAVSGDGSAGSPFQQLTVYEGDVAMNPGDVDFVETEPIRVEQTVTYRNGDGHFDVEYRLRRIQPVDSQWGGTVTVVRPSVSADLHVDGSDSGVGFLEAGPPRVVGGRNATTGATGGIVEVDTSSNAWAHYEENDFSTVFEHLSIRGSGLTDTIETTDVDNGVGVQFPDTAVCAGSGCEAPATVTFATRWRFQPAPEPPPAQTPPPTTTETTETTETTTPPPPPPQEQPQEPQDPVFPEGTPTGRTISDLPEPSTGKTVNIGRVRGTVLVKYPEPSGGARASANSQAERGFVPLDGSAQIPIGSEVDTRKGVLRLQSGANSTGSRTQTATFFLGRFELRQRRSRRPVTEMVLKGGSFRRSCASSSATGDRTAGTSRHRRGRRVRRGKRVRRLWGRGRGRYRTRGRYSAATVRGTKWVVEERCNGTFTRVARRPRSSRVDVRDFVHRRTIRLRAGQSYFAPKGRIPRRGPQLAVTPRSTTPGGATTVVGRQWGARRLVTLFLDPIADDERTRVTRVRASRRGGFRTRIRVPAGAAPGRYVVRACRGSCRGTKSARLTVRAP